MEGEPVLGIQDHHCVEMSINAPNISEAHRWRNSNCYAQFRFLCESNPLISKSPDSKSAAVGKLQNTEQPKTFEFRDSRYEISMDKV